MANNPDRLREFTKRKLATARAAKNMSWSELTQVMKDLGIQVTDSTLTTRFSRGTFRIVEFLALLRVLGVRFLDLSELELEGLEAALGRVESDRKRRAAAGRRRSTR